MVMNVTPTMKKTKQQSHKSGFKPTPQGEATPFALLESEKEHLFIGEIFFLAKEKSPETGLAIVYRVLGTLIELKIVNEAGFSDGLARYDLRKEGAKHSHHHLLCLNCSTIEKAEEDLLLEVERVIGEHCHFLVKGHRLTFHEACQEYYEEEKRNQSV